MVDMDKALFIPPDKKDPKYRYAFVLDEPKTMTVFKMNGYEAVKLQDPDGQKFKDDPRLSADGKIRVGDVMLMRCPEEMAKEREMESKKRREGRIPTIKEDFHGTAGSLGLKTFEENKP